MRRLTCWISVLGLVFFFGAPLASGADWPTWRFDAHRSAACPEELPEQLHLQWVRELSPVLSAWPNEPRLHFDASHEPVVVGKLLLLGSPNDGSVTAFNTESGDRSWKFHAEGPVRFAPAVHNGHVYVGSDDGYLYCLDVRDGKLLWKFRGAPDDRPDRRHLGNNRLISFWPVRGGPVVVDGTVYFGAGIWPTMGVFVVALEADSGKLIWRNGDVSLIEKVRVDHNTLKTSGLSPQGYLVVQGDTLLVPNGRSMPAGLDRKTGKLLYYIQGYRNGDCRVTAMGKYAFVGESAVVDTKTGREVGSRWADAGSDAPKAFDGRYHLFEGPYMPYKLFVGCSWRSVLMPGVSYGLHAGVFHAYDLTRAKLSEYEAKHMQKILKPWRWDVPAVWKLPVDGAEKKPAGEALIKAGRRLYGGVGSDVIALELPDSAETKPRIAWKMDVGGTPSSMIAADGKLFVVSDTGRISCFGAKQTEPKTHGQSATPKSPDDRWSRLATDVLANSKVTEGYCLVLGLESGRLVEELLGQSKLKLIGIDADGRKINALRDKLAETGLYGTRVELFAGNPTDFPFPPYLASLIVSEKLDTNDFAKAASAKKLFAVLRPYGGVACLSVRADRYDQFEKWVNGARLENAQVDPAGQTDAASNFALLHRVGKLSGSANWTHECADAARTFFSEDNRVKMPLGVLWYGDGPGYGFWKRKDYGIGVKPQVVGGRLFAFQVGKRELVAYDVYTGRQFWTQPADPFTRYVSFPDAIYVAGADGCAVLDPATGQRKALFPYKGFEGKNPCVADIRVAGDLILVALAAEKVRVIEKGLWDATTLVALDRTGGATLWTRQAKHRFNSNALAIGGGRVFCIDSVSPAVAGKSQRRGDEKELPSTILALDARSGKTAWTATTINPHEFYDAMGQWGAIRSRDDWLAYSEQHGILITGKQKQGHALDAKTGKPLWNEPISGQPCVIRADTYIPQDGHTFDIRSGKPRGGRLPVTRGGCNYFVAGRHLLLLRDRSVCYIDLDSDRNRTQHLLNIRSGCSNSLIAADGLLNVPNFAVGCVCNYPIQTSFSMVTMPETAAWASETPISEAYKPKSQP